MTGRGWWSTIGARVPKAKAKAKSSASLGLRERNKSTQTPDLGSQSQAQTETGGHKTLQRMGPSAGREVVVAIPIRVSDKQGSPILGGALEHGKGWSEAHGGSRRAWKPSAESGLASRQRGRGEGSPLANPGHIRDVWPRKAILNVEPPAISSSSGCQSAACQGRTSTCCRRSCLIGERGWAR